MTTITDHDHTASYHLPSRLRLSPYFRLLRRHWRQRVWVARMYRELTSARLLADVGQAEAPYRSKVVGLARMLGGGS